MPRYLDQPTARVDGHLKVTGQAHYTAETAPGSVLFGGMVLATIGKGRIAKIDSTMAESLPGVLGVVDMRTAPTMHRVETFPRGPAGETFVPLQGPEIRYPGQPIGLVVASTLEMALTAALFVQVHYENEEPETFDGLMATGLPASAIRTQMGNQHGDKDAAWQSASARLEAEYDTPGNHPAPMELHATVAEWKGDILEVTDTSQWPLGVRFTLATMLGIPRENVHVKVPYVGGAFGGKVLTYAHTLFTALAAKRFGKPVKTILTRDQAINTTGYRPASRHQMRLSASTDGQLGLIEHRTISQTSISDRYLLPAGEMSEVLYAASARDIQHWLVPVNASTPSIMRAPGEAPGMFALESAIDELAWALKLDPIALRLKNMPDKHASGLRWSSHELAACLTQGAAAFGWQTPKAPREIEDGDWWIGHGVSAACYGAYRSQAALRLRLDADGRFTASTATSEIGNGVQTVLTQILCDALQVPFTQVALRFGDTDFPAAPVVGASRTTASIGPAALDAVNKLTARLHELALDGTARFEAGCLIGADGRTESATSILERHGLSHLECEGFAGPAELGKDAWETLRSGVNTIRLPLGRDAAMFSFGAHFTALRVHKRLGTVKVDRIVGRYAAGRILNHTGARNQILGGLVFGLGQALMEEVIYDPIEAKILNSNLNDYRVPVAADMPEFDIGFVSDQDLFANELGTKSVGELGCAGLAASIGNAVYHATGIRVRRLPIHPESLI